MGIAGGTTSAITRWRPSARPYGTDLSVNPTNGMVAVFMIQCSGPDLWAARDLFLKTATEVFSKNGR